MSPLKRKVILSFSNPPDDDSDSGPLSIVIMLKDAELDGKRGGGSDTFFLFSHKFIFCHDIWKTSPSTISQVKHFQSVFLRSARDG
jgi:hypothetical protein